MGHIKIIKRHVLFTNSVISCGMKAEIFRSKLVDFDLSEDGGGRYHGRYKGSAQSWAKGVVTTTSELWLRRM